MRHRHSLRTARCFLLKGGRASGIFLLLCASAAAAEDEKPVASLAIAGQIDDDAGLGLAVVPELRLTHAEGDITFDFTSKGRAELGDAGNRLGDATNTATATAEWQQDAATVLSLEASYYVDRDYDPDFAPRFAAIDTEHEISGTIGWEHVANDVRLRLDAGAAVSLKQDLERIGFSSFDRGNRNFIEPELAAGVTFNMKSDIRPFAELAVGSRTYLEGRDDLGRNRNYQGMEILAGVEFAKPSLTGELGAILVLRDHAEAGVKDRMMLGPFINLIWKPGEKTELRFAANGSLEQEASGSVESYPVYTVQWAAKQILTENIMLRAGSEVKLEDFPGNAATITITPEAALDWRLSKHVTATAALGASWEKDKGERADLSATASAGVKLEF